VVWNSTSLELPGIIWNKIEFEDNLPALNGHSACKINDHSVFVFGGKSSNGNFTDSSFIVDLETKTVQHLETKGKKPKPRAFHVILILD
jgi:Galactose oxidase, central domain